MGLVPQNTVDGYRRANVKRHVKQKHYRHTYYISTVSNGGLRNIPQGQHRLVAAQVVYAIANYAAVVS
jgi:hypothetical protein